MVHLHESLHCQCAEALAGCNFSGSVDSHQEQQLISDKKCDNYAFDYFWCEIIGALVGPLDCSLKKIVPFFLDLEKAGRFIDKASYLKDLTLNSYGRNNFY